jgi:hypothetical protein
MTSPDAFSNPRREERHAKVVFVILRRSSFQVIVPAMARIQGRQGSSTEALDPRFRGGDDYPDSSNFDNRE